MNGKIFEMNVEEFKTIYAQEKSIIKISKLTGYGSYAIRSFMKRNNINLKYKTTYEHDDNFFSKENEESFYWAGFLAADGCVMNKKRSYTFLLKLALARKDLTHLEKFKKALKATEPIKIFMDKKGHVSCNFNIVSKQICEDLVKFGIVPRKTFILKFPEFVKNHKFIYSYIRGYIDGDGCFTKHKQYKKCDQNILNILGTKEFLNVISEIFCKDLKINERIIHKKGNIYSITFSGNIIVNKIVNLLYKDSTVELDRKKNIVL